MQTVVHLSLPITIWLWYPLQNAEGNTIKKMLVRSKSGIYSNYFYIPDVSQYVYIIHSISHYCSWFLPNIFARRPKLNQLAFYWACEKPLRFFIITLSSGQVCGRSKLTTEVMRRVLLFRNSRFKSLVRKKKCSKFFFVALFFILLLLLVIIRATLFLRK